jgi:diacylglycerol kinase (ATP)
MKVVLLQNQASGAGAGGTVADRLVPLLRDTGMQVHAHRVGPGCDPHGYLAALNGADALVILGGDGTLHHALPAAVRAGVPVYQVPMGTENLFAREFGMDQSPDRLRQVLVSPNSRRVDVATCNDRMFVLMCSVGFDANVVERVAAGRTGTVSKLDYVAHGVREFIDPRIPTLSVEVDGVQLVRDEPGMVVVANSRQYAARLDPARKALMDDGALDVVFYPHKSRVQLGVWGLRTALGTHMASPELAHATGKKVLIRTKDPAPFQLDGEAAGSIHPLVTDQSSLAIEIIPQALSVLVPLTSAHVRPSETEGRTVVTTAIGSSRAATFGMVSRAAGGAGTVTTGRSASGTLARRD